MLSKSILAKNKLPIMLYPVFTLFVHRMMHVCGEAEERYPGYLNSKLVEQSEVKMNHWLKVPHSTNNNHTPAK